MDRLVVKVFLCLIGLASMANADLRNKPYEAPLPPLEFDAFVLSVSVNTAYQWVTGAG